MPMAFAMTVLDRNGRLVYGMDYSMGHSLIKLIFLNLPHIASYQLYRKSKYIFLFWECNIAAKVGIYYTKT